MSRCQIFHNPRCSKSRQTLALLEEHGIQPQVVLYLEQAPTADELRAVLKKLGLSARELLRKGEDEYKQLGLENSHFTDDDIIAAMCAHPKLIERPIVIKGHKAVIGRPPENILQLL
jgi:arsenate reductase